MKKEIIRRLTLVAMVACLFSVPVLAQKSSSTEEQWNSLLIALSTEDWDSAYRLSGSLIERIKTDNSDKDLAKIRYMFLYSGAGRVLAGKMTYDELEKVVKPFVGTELVIPFRTVRETCGGSNLNSICADNKDKKSLLVPATNKAGTTILAFEYYKFKDDPKLSRSVGSAVSFSGIVTAIQPNPNRSNLIILRIYLDDAKIFETRKK
jgi:hypothetical protein